MSRMVGVVRHACKELKCVSRNVFRSTSLEVIAIKILNDVLVHHFNFLLSNYRAITSYQIHLLYTYYFLNAISFSKSVKGLS